MVGQEYPYKQKSQNIYTYSHVNPISIKAWRGIDTLSGEIILSKIDLFPFWFANSFLSEKTSFFRRGLVVEEGKKE